MRVIGGDGTGPAPSPSRRAAHFSGLTACGSAVAPPGVDAATLEVGLISTTYSCTRLCTNTPQPVCGCFQWDSDGFNAQDVAAMQIGGCVEGIFDTTPCTSTGRVGRCQWSCLGGRGCELNTHDGTPYVSTTAFYPPYTTSQSQDFCTSSTGTWSP